MSHRRSQSYPQMLTAILALLTLMAMCECFMPAECGIFRSVSTASMTDSMLTPKLAYRTFSSSNAEHSILGTIGLGTDHLPPGSMSLSPWLVFLPPLERSPRKVPFMQL